ncbi:hypothetical protein [Desulforamulus ferrireducens]|uniref:Uncharacterized protein n=1 Tax=Desulforamulus ferrireducens TaxID=1833852 RepID=A0A1S6IVZ4_9FIRM|nr:hypothetical protein [Desulforamulus ferrireducens]AQS58957.1 hypothetical protein B0537_07590 [Desulforamulus ferrireducens]
MLREIEEIKLQSKQEIKELRQRIQALRSYPFMRWDTKAAIKKAEEKIEMIQQLLVKLEALAEQVYPVVKDLKTIIGVKKVNSGKNK